MQKFNRQNVKQFRQDFQSAISKLEKQYECKINIGNIRFSDTELRTKLTANTLSGPVNKTATFVLGEEVKINHRKSKGKLYTIIKKNRVNWLLTEKGGFGRVKVSPSLILKK